MLFKSQIFTQVSGSIGGTTFSRNKGGLYTRARSVPVNPNSTAQIAARNAFSSLVNAWTEILTGTQRDAWDLYALNTPVTNVFGDSKTLTGQQMYIRSNQPRVRQGEARVDSGPVIFDLGTFTTPVLTINETAPNTISVAFTNTDTWAIAVGGFLFALASRGQNQSKNFFKGPFRSAGNIAGAVVPPGSPEALTSPFPYAEDQKVFVAFRAGQPDGRLSNQQIVETIVAA